MTASTFRDCVWMTVSGTPGTGNVTLNAAVLGGFRTAAAAGVADGETNTWKFVDGNNFEVSSCVYTAAGTSLARTLIESSTGSLLSLSSAATAMLTGAAQDVATSYAEDLQLFGDGSDGNVTINGAVSLSRDMFYSNLTVTTGAVLKPNGWRIFVSGVLDITAAPVGSITMAGSDGNAATSTSAAGTGGASGGGSGSLSGSAGGGAGNAGGTTTGTGNAFGSNGAQGGLAGASGAGGAGASGAGGNGGTTPNATYIPLPFSPLLSAQSTTTAYAQTNAGAKAAAAGSGGGDGTNRGGASGGTGAAGGVLYIAARTINRGASTAAGCITVRGNSGGAGFAPTAGNCGGAGGTAGSGGGWIVLVFRNLTGSLAPNAIELTGGNGAAGTNGIGTGLGGDGGASGAGGRAHVFNLSTGVLTHTTPAASVAGGAHAGIAGGSAGVATVSRVSL